MQRDVFDGLRSLVRQQAGITLPDGKEALVEARIAPRLRALALTGAAEYLALLQTRRDAQELARFVDVMTTNVTSFFREPSHFDVLRAEVARRSSEGASKLRVWSAAASTGPEPYSIAMTLADAAPGLDKAILATDISERALARARAGVYTARELEPVSPQLRARHFDKVEHRGEPAWRTSRALRSMICFAQVNLAAPPLPMRGPFDVIVCRNVMIYFDASVRQRLVREMERVLAPGGLLIVGHAETLQGLSTSLRHEALSLYRAPAAPLT